MRDLGLEDRLLMTSKNSVAAQNRFIYYPDHLVRMPGPGVSLLKNISNVWSEPLFHGTISSALIEITRPPRSPGLQDESIGSFISRRFGSALADNVVSAVFHGIYAGDIYKLSARTILAGAWQLETRYQSLVKGLFNQSFGEVGPIATDDLAVVKEYQSQQPMPGALETAKNSSVFTFKGGIGELASRLESKLLESPNVNIKQDTYAREIMLKGDKTNYKVCVSADSNDYGGLYTLFDD